MKKKTAKKTTAKKKAAPRKTAAAKKPAPTYTPKPVESSGWTPFRYPPQ